MKIDFEYATDYGVFRDAITLPDNHSYTDDELEAMNSPFGRYESRY